MVSNMVPGRNAVRDVLICLLLVVGILAIYAPAVDLNFITYDDPDYVTSNAQVRAGLSWSSVRWAFGHTSSSEWHPLTMLSHMVDCQLFGLNPKGHHLTNLLLHLANTLVLLLLLSSITDTFWPSAFVTFLFALHPVNVEAVAWISERKGLLSTFFGLLCLWCYGRYVKATQRQGSSSMNPAQLSPKAAGSSTPSRRSSGTSILAPLTLALRSPYYNLALVFFSFGLLSKPMLVPWPCAMLLLDYWPLGRFSSFNFTHEFLSLKRVVLEKVPFFVLSVTSCVVTLLVGRAWGAVTTAVDTPISSRLSNTLVAYILYLQKLIWPTNLSINYPFVLHRPLGQVVAAAATLVAITAFVLSQCRKRPFLAVGWAWYIGTLVPVIGILHFGNHFMADRYSYVTAIGLFIMLSWAAAEFASSSPARRVATATCAVVSLILCAVIAQTQLLYWQNSETLFRHAIAVNRNDFVAENNLGFYLDSLRELAEAEQCYRAALTISPGSTFALQKLAVLLITKGRTEEAVSACEAALALDPRMPDAHSTLGLAFMKLGRRKEALEQYAEAIRIRSDFAPAHYNMANALAAQGQFQQARDHYRESLRWDPDSEDAHSNLGFLLAREGSLEEAVAQFRAALELKSGMWQAEYGLADALSRQGKIKEAAEHYRAALRARPNFPEALTHLAWLLATSTDANVRRGPESVSLAERACHLTGYKQVSSLRALAAAYAEMGRGTEATECAEKAASIAVAAGQNDLAQRIRESIELFRSGHAYREPEGAPAQSP
jgi:tetratricopeptide (TPR) repeat protein